MGRRDSSQHGSHDAPSPDLTPESGLVYLTYLPAPSFGTLFIFRMNERHENPLAELGRESAENSNFTRFASLLGPRYWKRRGSATSCPTTYIRRSLPSGKAGRGRKGLSVSERPFLDQGLPAKSPVIDTSQPTTVYGKQKHFRVVARRAMSLETTTMTESLRPYGLSL